MIRRLFWLTLGAALGVTGYRRVTALARSIWPASRAGPAARAGDAAAFAADVREGMALYKQRHHRPEGPTLESHRQRGSQQSRTDDKDGR